MAFNHHLLVPIWYNHKLIRRLLNAMLAPIYMALLLTVLLWPAIIAQKPIHVGTNILHHDVLYRSLLPRHQWGSVTARSWDPASYLLTIPVDVLAADYFRRGRLPLWNAYNGLGVPLLGEGTAAPFSPFKLLLYLFPTMPAYSFYLVLCLYVAGIAAYALARLIGFSRTGSLLTATSFALSTWILRHLQTCDTPPLVLLPLVIWVLEHLHRKPTFVHGTVVGLTMGFVSLTGHLEAALWTGLAGAFYVVLRIVGDAIGIGRQRGFLAVRPYIMPRVGALMVAFLIFGAFATITIVPLYTLIQDAGMSAGASNQGLKLVRNLYDMGLLWRVVVPSFFLHIITPDARITNLAEWNIYAGPFTLGLAVIGLMQKQHRQSNLAIGGGLLLVGVIFPHYYNTVPMICGLALLSGRGLDALRAAAKAYPLRWVLWRSGWSLPVGIWLAFLFPVIGLSWSIAGAGEMDPVLWWALQGSLILLLATGLVFFLRRLIQAWALRARTTNWAPETVVVWVGCVLLLVCAMIGFGREIKVSWGGFVAEGLSIPFSGEPAREWSARAWRNGAAWEAHELMRPEPFSRFIDLGAQPMAIFEPDKSVLDVVPNLPAWKAGDLLDFESPEGRVVASLRSGFEFLVSADALLYALGMTSLGLMVTALFWKRPGFMPVMLLLLTAGLLVKDPPLGPQERFSFDVTPAIRWIQDHAGAGRVLSWPVSENGIAYPYALAPITNAPQGIFTGSLLAFFQSCRYRQVLDLANGLDRPSPCGPRIRTVATQPGSPWSNLLGFRYVVTPAEVEGHPTADSVVRYNDDTVRIYEIGSALPRAWLVSDIDLVAKEHADDVIYTINAEKINPVRTGLMEMSTQTEDVAQLLTDHRIGPGQEGTATVTTSLPDIMDIHTASPVPSVLITSDELSPGWTVYVDGVPAIPLQANYLLRAVFVPAGEHTVRWEYRPQYVGPVLLTILGALLVVAIGLILPSLPMLINERAGAQRAWISTYNTPVMLVGWVLLVLVVAIFFGFTHSYWS